MPEKGGSEAARLHSSRIRSQALAFAAIRGLSWLTIIILGLILGFILWRGFRYGNETRQQTLRYAEAAPEGLSLVMNRATRTGDLEFAMVQGMFSDSYINWAKISGDDFDLLPVAVDPATPDGAAAEAFLFGGVPLWGGLVQTVPSVEAALALVRSTPGAVTLIPAKSVPKAGDFVTSAVRRLVLILNPAVTELVDNRSLEDLDDAAIAKIAEDKASNWKEFGGPDLPLVLLAPPAGSELARAVSASGFKPQGRTEPDLESYLAALGSESGAVGFAWQIDGLNSGLPMAMHRGFASGWNLTLSYLLEAPRLSGRVGGISTIILNTFFMLILTVLLAGPIGVAAAVYLVEYARQGFFVSLLRLGTETLAGIPSIIFGLFGMVFFVETLHFGFGLLSGCLTLMIMILPTIVRTSEEALKAVPGGLREGSLALGATKLQTILRVAIPAAAPGILTGLILAMGRAVGETAALLFTLGSDYKLAKGLFTSARALSAHVYLLFAEGISFDRAFSTATVLIVIVLGFNFAARRIVTVMNRNA
jgi:phosphate transport system permease protein